MKRLTLAVPTVMAMILLITAGAPSASADVISFQLTSDHCGGDNTNSNAGCLPVGGSAGTITITDVSTGVVSVDVTLGSAYKFVNGGFDISFGFNLPAIASITYSGITTGFKVPGGGTTQTNGNIHMDGTGFFDYGLDCTGCGSGGSSPLPGPLDFHISATGLSTTSFKKNSSGEFFAADIIGQGVTGGVDASAQSSVPDGGMTLILLGGALVGIESLRRKLRA